MGTRPSTRAAAATRTGRRRSSPRPGSWRSGGRSPSPAPGTAGRSPGPGLTPSGWACWGACAPPAPGPLGAGGRPPDITTPGGLPALRLLELPIPVIFNPYPLPAPNRHPFVAAAMAAHRPHTLAVLDPEEESADLEPFAEALAPRVPLAHLEALRHLWARASYVELEGDDLAAATARA